MSFFCINSNENKKDSYFKGYAFTSNSLVMNHGGYEKYNKEHGNLFDSVEDGRFLLFEKNGDVFRLRADPAGQSIIYYYINGGFWAISDSLLELSRKIASFGFDRKVYQPSVDVFKNDRLSLIGGQLVSNNTVLEDVKILGLSEYIELSWAAGQDKIKVKSLPEKRSYENYEDFLYDFVSSWRGRLEAISYLKQESYLALSGGVDSRAVIALWGSSAVNKKINCHSHKKYEVEYEIAKQLCSLTNQKFGSGMKGLDSVSLSPEESYDLSMAGNASVKTNYGFRRNAIVNPQLHFIGGCAVGSFYMKSSYKARATRLAKQFGTAGENVANEILLSLNSLGIDKDNPWAMFYHYYNHRARHHYGNDVYTRFGAIQVQPLLDSRLHQIPYLVDKEYVEGNGVVRDIISVVNEELLAIPFDSPDKVKAKNISFSKKLSSIENSKYKCFYSDLNDSFDFSGHNTMPKKDWHNGLKSILSKKKNLMADRAVELGFSDFYIRDAIGEIDLLNEKAKLKKSGVLLGLYEALGS